MIEAETAWHKSDCNNILNTKRTVPKKDVFAMNPDKEVFLSYIRSGETLMADSTVYTITEKHRVYDLYFCFEKKPPSRKKMETMLKFIHHWIYLADPFSQTTCSNKINVFFFLTGLKKKMPSSSSDIINTEHANTAVTRGCVAHNNNITVYRKEEWFKVFMHETFHALGLDFCTLDQSRVDRQLKHIFPVTQNMAEIRYYEAYTEVWAELMNILFLVFSAGIREKKEFVESVQQVLSFEISFSLYQGIKVLRHYGIDFAEIYHQNHQKKYRQLNSCTFSYYVLKTVLLSNISAFLEFCGDRVFAFEKTDPNLDAFVRLVKNHKVNASMLREARSIHLPLDTLRMTAFDAIDY